MPNKFLTDIKRFEILARDKEVLKKIFHLATICNEKNKVIIINNSNFIQIEEDSSFLDSPVYIQIFKDFSIKSYFLGDDMKILNFDEVNKLLSGVKNE